MMRHIKKINKITLLVFKIFSAFCVAYVLSLIGQELLSYGLFSFIFLLFSIGWAFFLLIKPYNFLGVFIVDMVLVFIALLLRFYVIVAYSA